MPVFTSGRPECCTYTDIYPDKSESNIISSKPGPGSPVQFVDYSQSRTVLRYLCSSWYTGSPPVHTVRGIAYVYTDSATQFSVNPLLVQPDLTYLPGRLAAAGRFSCVYRAAATAAEHSLLLLLRRPALRTPALSGVGSKLAVLLLFMILCRRRRRRGCRGGAEKERRPLPLSCSRPVLLLYQQTSPLARMTS